MTNERKTVQALPSLCSFTKTEKKAAMHITTKQPVEFTEEGYEDRAKMYPVCPSCKEYLDNERWNFCPYYGIPVEWCGKVVSE